MNLLPVVRQGKELYCLDIPLFDILKLKKKQQKRKPIPACAKTVFNPRLDSDDSKRNTALACAWKRLANATLSADTLYDLILVLTETTSYREIRIVERYPLGSEPMDIRPHLSDRSAIAQFLDSLSPFWKKAIHLAEADKLLPKRLLRKLRENEQLRKIDLFLYSRCGIEIPADKIQFSESVSTWLLPHLPEQKAGLDDLIQLAEWFEYSSLLPNSNWIQAILISVIKRYPPAASWRWCQLLLEIPQEFIHQQAERILHKKTLKYYSRVDDDLLECFAYLDRIFPDPTGSEKYHCGWSFLFAGIQKGLAPEALLNGLRLWFLSKNAPNFLSFSESNEFRLDHFIEIEQTIYERDHPSQFLTSSINLDIYNLLGEYPKAGSALKALCDYQEATNKRFRTLLRFLVYEVEWDEPVSLNKSRIKRLVDFCEDNEIDYHKEECLRFIHEYFNYRFCSRKGTFDTVLAIAQRHWDLKIEPTWNMSTFWSGWVQAARIESLASRVKQLPDSVFRAVQEMGRSHNRCQHTALGNWRFCWRFPFDALEMLTHFPTKYLSVIQELNQITKQAQKVVYERYRHHPVSEMPPWTMDLDDALVLVESSLVGTHHKSPFPKRLRNHILSKRMLEPKIIERDLEVFRKNCYYLRLEILENEISRCLPAPEPTLDSHTLRLAHQIRQNRRPLNRIIQKVRSSIDLAKEYIIEHPNNLLWLTSQKEKGIAVDTWMKGVTLIDQLEDVGSIKIFPESNPEEILKMGTYVGSCLAVGSCNAWSAVANLLDINKQVVYVHDDKGKVIGRQLVALSEQGELVCFDIYTLKSHQNLQNIMYRYDHLLAKRLGIPIFNWEGKGEYEIKNLICKDWYNDYPIEVPSPEEILKLDG